MARWLLPPLPPWLLPLLLLLPWLLQLLLLLPGLLLQPLLLQPWVGLGLGLRV